MAAAATAAIIYWRLPKEEAKTAIDTTAQAEAVIERITREDYFRYPSGRRFHTWLTRWL